jgi:hypothetical protein
MAKQANRPNAFARVFPGMQKPEKKSISDRAKKAADDILANAVALSSNLISNLNQMHAAMWTPQDKALHPEDIAEALGPEAASLFEAHAKFAALLRETVPGLPEGAILGVPDEYTVTTADDGKVELKRNTKR